MAEPSFGDWQEIGKLFIGGLVPISDIATKFNVDQSTIWVRARREGWTRDVVAVAARQSAAISRANSIGHGQEIITPEMVLKVLEDEIDAQVTVSKRHRIAANGARRMVVGLLAELQEVSDPENQTEIDDAIYEETRGDANGLRRSQMQRAVSLSGRASIAQNLVTALGKLVEIERTAYGLDAGKEDEPDAKAKEIADGRVTALYARLDRLAKPRYEIEGTAVEILPRSGAMPKAG